MWKERMAVGVSKAEMRILEELNKRNEFPITQKQFCLLQTVPDFYFPDINLAVYIDGEDVHKDREDRDEYLRGLLKKRHGCTVVSYTYKRPSKGVIEGIVEQIMDDAEGLRKMLKT